MFPHAFASHNTTFLIPSVLEGDPEASLAVALGVAAHGDTEDKSGQTYHYHPQRVGFRGVELALLNQRVGEALVPGISDQDFRRLLLRIFCTGQVHDVFEDTDKDDTWLISKGFPAEFVPSVRSVTKSPGERYTDAIQRAKEDLAGRFVKMADLTDNSTLARIPMQRTLGTRAAIVDPLDYAIERHEKYFWSYLYLADQIDQTEFLTRVRQLKFRRNFRA